MQERRPFAPIKERIERCWAWLDHWGHIVDRVDLEGLTVYELLDLAANEARRVQVLAERWEAWW